MTSRFFSNIKIGCLCAMLVAMGACGGGSQSTTAPVNLPAVDAVEFGPIVPSSSGYDTVSVAWPSDQATLRGTLWFPNVVERSPAVIMHFGSTRWTRFDIRFGLIEPWLEQGIAVLVYDKRGVGASGGECCPTNDPGYFPLLATDLIEGIAALQSHPDIDPLRIGLYGFSQGGWVLPNAAANSPSVAFTVIGSGPTVSLGEELLYSQLTGDNNCTPSGLTEADIDSRMAQELPSGFDPRQDLQMYTIPGLWLYGARDRSVPVRQSVAILEDTRTSLGKEFTVVIFPGANHSLIQGGAMCQTNGPSVDFFTPMFDWLLPILN